MPSTPNRGYPYPNEWEDPYWDTIVSTFTSIDTDVNALYGVRSVPLGGTGQSTLASGAYLRGAGTSAITTQAIPIPVAHGGTGATTFTAGYLKGSGTAAITSQATIPVADGGTGASTLTAGYALMGQGTGAITWSPYVRFNVTQVGIWAPYQEIIPLSD